MAFMDAGKPQYTTDSNNMSVKTELQIVKSMRLVLRGIEFLIKTFFGFIKTIIKEVTHPGSTYR